MIVSKAKIPWMLGTFHVELELCPLSSAHCLHHIMKIEKNNFKIYKITFYITYTQANLFIGKYEDSCSIKVHPRERISQIPYAPWLISYFIFWCLSPIKPPKQENAKLSALYDIEQVKFQDTELKQCSLQWSGAQIRLSEHTHSALGHLALF